MAQDQTNEIEDVKPKKKHPIIKSLLFLIITALLLASYARFISTSGLTVKEYKIESSKLPTNFNGFKIVHLSDLHYGTTIHQKELKNIVNKINDLKPDIVVSTGDLIDKDTPLNTSDLEILKNELSKINAKLFKYSVLGNHDYSNNSITDVITKANFIILNNERKDIYYEGHEPISIYGFPSYFSGNPDYSILNEENNNFKIVLIHEPDVTDQLLNSNPDLILAGHSHNGQVRLPFIGAIYKTNGSKKYFDEHYELNNTNLYISSGIGTSTLKVRFFNRPSINLYRFYTTN